MNHGFRNAGSFSPLPEVMPFGRFRGEPIRDLPGWYLEWLQGRPHLNPALRRKVIFVDAMRDLACDQQEGR